MTREAQAAFREQTRAAREAARELQQEALDLAGWGFVLYRRIVAMRCDAPLKGEGEG
jgi:hypothetical protein